MQPEARLQKNIALALQSEGRFAMRQRLAGRRGWPDLYVILRCGHPAHLEVKQPGGKPDPLQAHTLEHLRRAGAVTGCVTSVDEALAVVTAHEGRCVNFRREKEMGR